MKKILCLLVCIIPDADVISCFLRQVREILGQCSCPAQFPMIKVSEGKYKVGDSSALIFIRVRSDAVHDMTNTETSSC